MGSRISTDCDNCINETSATPTHPAEDKTTSGTSSSDTKILHNLSNEGAPLGAIPPRSSSASSYRRRRENHHRVKPSFSISRFCQICIQIMTGNIRTGYFRSYTHSKGMLYGLAIAYVVSCSVVSMFQPFLVVCEETAVVSDFENPGYAFTQECHHTRNKYLLYMTPEECTFGRRIVSATIFGALIGWERRRADRPAGIRTMALASLGSCLFSICGTFAFIDGPMGWDASRISAAIPSGVGFLGAGIIWKQTDKDSNAQSVHGLTTAASLWLSAAVGIACAGELYFAASFSIACMMILLRFGPRIIVGEDPDFLSEREYDLESNEQYDEYPIPKEVRDYRYRSISVGSDTLQSPPRNTSTPGSRSRNSKVIKVGLMKNNIPSIRE